MNNALLRQINSKTSACTILHMVNVPIRKELPYLGYHLSFQHPTWCHNHCHWRRSPYSSSHQRLKLICFLQTFRLVIKLKMWQLKHVWIGQYTSYSNGWLSVYECLAFQQILTFVLLLIFNHQSAKKNCRK